MLSRIRIFMVAVLAFSMVGVVAVQAQDEVEGPTLESVTGTEDYYGQNVTLEGQVREFLGSRIFVLSEGAALDDDAVLVINMGSEEIDLSVVKGTRVSLSGTVQPSLNYITDNELTAPVYTPADDVDMGTDVDMEPTADMAMEMTATPEGDMAVEPTAEGDMAVEPTTEGDMAVEPTAEGDMAVEPTAEGDMAVEPTTEGDMAVEPTAEGDMAVEPTAEGDMAVEPTTEGEMDVTATPVPETDTDMGEDMGETDGMMSVPDAVNFYYAGNLPDDYDSYTVLIIDSASVITIIPEETE
ncbi:hypothetical protein G4Y79_19180 [Phototrophicus methaneseepsis]|uniref:Bacterial OB-fold domain-containing protein n=1 Tax=Phototrophicus methaneseepsis TaxID=2710758 RepID=A0A7S8IEG3_9CHLR|nr:hypothetical protein [Phototrophicus methaneseepsis]QPC81793.1 hypothetical protein G4Y79_19180 [Phototrophicus methaneseepsis]